MKINRFAPVALIACAVLASACANTIRGVGADAANTVDATQNAGNRVARSAQ